MDVPHAPADDRYVEKQSGGLIPPQMNPRPRYSRDGPDGRVHPGSPAMLTIPLLCFFILGDVPRTLFGALATAGAVYVLVRIAASATVPTSRLAESADRCPKSSKRLAYPRLTGRSRPCCSRLRTSRPGRRWPPEAWRAGPPNAPPRAVRCRMQLSPLQSLLMSALLSQPGPAQAATRHRPGALLLIPVEGPRPHRPRLSPTRVPHAGGRPGTCQECPLSKPTSLPAAVPPCAVGG